MLTAAPLPLFCLFVCVGLCRLCLFTLRWFELCAAGACFAPARALTAAHPGTSLPPGRYSCGRLASNGYAPSPVALQLLWDRTHKLALSFDSQGIANILWCGQLPGRRWFACQRVRVSTCPLVCRHRHGRILLSLSLPPSSPTCSNACPAVPPPRRLQGPGPAAQEARRGLPAAPRCPGLPAVCRLPHRALVCGAGKQRVVGGDGCWQVGTWVHMQDAAAVTCQCMAAKPSCYSSA